MWLRDGSLACDTDDCDSLYGSRGADGSTLMGARAKGWHIYDGPAADGVSYISSHLCPRCIGTPRTPLRKAPDPHVNDQLLPLFSEAA